MKTFKQTVELNDKNKPSTGMATAYSGKSPWPKAFKEYYFLEISDCHSKIRLHNSQVDTKRDFIKKLKRLRNLIDTFIKHLED